jgi:hypothetical protein
MTAEIREDLIAPVTFIEYDALRDRVSLLEEIVQLLLRAIAAEGTGAPEALRMVAEEILVTTLQGAVLHDAHRALEEGAASETARHLRDL